MGACGGCMPEVAVGGQGLYMFCGHARAILTVHRPFDLVCLCVLQVSNSVWSLLTAAHNLTITTTTHHAPAMPPAMSPSCTRLPCHHPLTPCARAASLVDPSSLLAWRL